MVIALNFAIFFIVLFFGALTYMLRKNKKLAYTMPVLGLLTIIGYTAVQPSYMPKGTAPRMPQPVFADSDAVIEDRLLKPDMTKEEREAHFDEKMNWDEKIEEANEKAEQDAANN